MSTALADATWTEVPRRPVVLVPLGSTEQHGPHLSFATDTVIAAAVAHAAAPRIEGILGQPVLVAPALPYGASGEHQGFPGTVSIGHDALRLVLIEMIRSLATWADRIVLVNGHGGNLATVTAAVRQMLDEQHQVSAVMCALETPSDAHAGHDETSVMLHLAASAVDMSRAVAGNTDPLPAILPDLVAAGVCPVSPNGILGDPTRATAEDGGDLFEQLVDRLVTQACHD